MADDRVLIDATNETFWQITGYKRGQRLDMSIPRDREMANTWRDINRQITGHRDRATEAAENTANAKNTPFVLVIEERDGSLVRNALENRAALETQYLWALNQPDYYTYLAAFDFDRNPSGPLHQQFALLQRKKTAASGWY